MAEQYQNIRVVLDKLMRHPLLSDVTLETAVDYCIDFMRIVGVPKMFEDKIADITITNYKGDLPSDWVETIQVKYFDTSMRYATDSYHLRQQNSRSEIIDNNSIETDAFEKIDEFLQVNKNMDIAGLSGDDSDSINIVANSYLVSNETIVGAIVDKSQGDKTFIIQGNKIITSMEQCTITMAYRAIATDESGLPLIPDNSNFTRALAAYIKLQHFTILFDLGKIHQHVFQQAQVDYSWAVGSCENEFKRLDLSKAESFFNSYRSLIIKNNQFQEGFRNNGRKG